jgi:hypothetical protein
MRDYQSAGYDFASLIIQLEPIRAARDVLAHHHWTLNRDIQRIVSEWYIELRRFRRERLPIILREVCERNSDDSIAEIALRKFLRRHGVSRSDACDYYKYPY